MSDFADGEGEDDGTFIFFFAGHGGAGALHDCLFTSDSKRFSEGIHLNELSGLFSKIAQRGVDVVAFLDCCSSGAVGINPGSVRDSAANAEALASALKHGIGSRAILASCLADEASEEAIQLGHGKFTYHLLQGLYGDAADQYGRITPGSIHQFIGPQFEAEASQSPAFYASMASDLVLSIGWDPVLGPPLEEEELKSIEDDADGLLDQYKGQLNSPEWSDWKEKGFSQAAVLLQQTQTWMESRQREYPALKRRKRFQGTSDAVRRQISQLGALETGTQIKEGEIEEVVGSGGFGTVWKVAGEERKFAFKVYHSNELGDEIKRSRFRRGFDAMERLGHPRVVKVHRFTDVPVGFVMDFIDGPNLKLLNPAKTQDAAAQVRLLVEISEAVAHAHERDVIHRDNKPENIVCRYTSGAAKVEPFLTDFDLAWINTASQVTRDGIGNYLYAAPEQLVNFSAKAVSSFQPTLDVFSLGQLAYFCVTGSDPNPTRRDENIENLARALREWPSGEAAGRRVDAYAKCTEESASNRFGTANELIEELFKIENAIRPEHLGELLSPERFQSELEFSFTGIAASQSGDAPCAFQSLSGQSHVTVDHKLREGSMMDMTIHVEPSGALTMTGKNNEELRKTLNARIRRALDGHNTVRVRPGNLGFFSVYIDISDVPIDSDGLSHVRSVLTSTLQTIEATA